MPLAQASCVLTRATILRHYFLHLSVVSPSCAVILRRHFAPPSCDTFAPPSCAPISFPYHLCRHLTPSHCAPILRLHSSTVLLVLLYYVAILCNNRNTADIIAVWKFLRKTFFARSYNTIDKYLTCCLLVCLLYFTTVNQTIIFCFPKI